MFKFFRAIAVVEIVIGCALLIVSFFSSNYANVFSGIGIGLCYGGLFAWLIGLCFYMAIDFSTKKESAYKTYK